MTPISPQALENEISAVSKAFSDKPFTPPRKRLIAGFLRDLPTKSVKIICQKLIGESRWLPLPKDFQALAEIEKKRIGVHDKVESLPAVHLDCTDCLASGLVYVTGKDLGGAMLMICGCPFGENQIWNLPRYSTHHFPELSILPMENYLEDYKPTEKAVTQKGDLNQNTLVLKVLALRERIENSRQFWVAYCQKEMGNGLDQKTYQHENELKRLLKLDEQSREAGWKRVNEQKQKLKQRMENEKANASEYE